jgi:hypothetical protein
MADETTQNTSEETSDESLEQSKFKKLLEEERKKWEEDYEKKKKVESEELLKKSVSTLKEQLRQDIEAAKKDALSKSKELEEAQKKLAELEKNKNSSPEELNRLKALADEKDELLKVSEPRTKELLEGLSKEFKETLNKKDLEIYVKEKIASANGEIIPDLVKGNTKEEVDQAYDLAIERYKEIVDRSVKKKEQEKLETGKLPDATKSGLNKTTNEKTAEDIARMSRKEFEEYSKNILKQYLS